MPTPAGGWWMSVCSDCANEIAERKSVAITKRTFFSKANHLSKTSAPGKHKNSFDRIVTSVQPSSGGEEESAAGHNPIKCAPTRQSQPFAWRLWRVTSPDHLPGDGSDMAASYILATDSCSTDPSQPPPPSPTADRVPGEPQQDRDPHRNPAGCRGLRLPSLRSAHRWHPAERSRPHRR